MYTTIRIFQSHNNQQEKRPKNTRILEFRSQSHARPPKPESWQRETTFILGFQSGPTNWIKILTTHASGQRWVTRGKKDNNDWQPHSACIQNATPYMIRDRLYLLSVHRSLALWLRYNRHVCRERKNISKKYLSQDGNACREVHWDGICSCASTTKRFVCCLIESHISPNVAGLKMSFFVGLIRLHQINPV